MICAISWECCVLVLLQVACMQFINIIVHSVEDVNFRVHLQHEFSLLGLDEYLKVIFSALYIIQSSLLSFPGGYVAFILGSDQLIVQK